MPISLDQETFDRFQIIWNLASLPFSEARGMNLDPPVPELY